MKLVHTNRGFAHITVTQVLLFLVVIGIAVAIAVPIAQKKSLEAKTEQVDSDLKVVRSALKAYFQQRRNVPAAPAWEDQPQDATKEGCSWQRELIDAKLLKRTFPDLFASEENSSTATQIKRLLASSGIRSMVPARLNEMTKRGMVFKPDPSRPEFKLTTQGERWIEDEVLAKLRGATA